MARDTPLSILYSVGYPFLRRFKKDFGKGYLIIIKGKGRKITGKVAQVVFQLPKWFDAVR